MPDDQFMDPVAERRASEALLVDLDGYEGPLDLLLTLARSQKVDLRRISILALAEQYLAFIEQAKRLRIELAADYLVMAAWLAWLKSRLLLPAEPGASGPSGEDLAAHLAFQLERLEAMRRVAAELMGRDRMGRDFFARGAPETATPRRRAEYRATLMELIQAYARIKTREEFRPLHYRRDSVMTMEQALERLRPILGAVPDWTRLSAFLPEGWQTDPKKRRSATAAGFAAVLELAKSGRLELRQQATFAPIEIRTRQA